jgi:integrase
MRTREVPRRLPKYCREDVDRHCNVRVYVVRPGRKKVRLHGLPWSVDFMQQYEAALALSETPAVKRSAVEGPRSGTLRWLVRCYEASGSFEKLDQVTKRRRRALLEAACLESIEPGSAIVFGDAPIARIDARAVGILRDRVSARAWSANNRLKAIRALFTWAISAPELNRQDGNWRLDANPAAAVPYIAAPSEGFHTWAADEVLQFLERHGEGSKARLAMSLLLYAGARRSDVVRFGRQHVRNGWLRYTQHKGRNRSPVTLEIPVLRPLAEELARLEHKHLASS